MLDGLTALWKDEDGPTSVEYALMLVVVSLAAIAAWRVFGSTVRDTVVSAEGDFPSVP